MSGLRFSPQCLAVLHGAGWSEARVVDTGDYRSLLAAEGYPVHACVLRFLRSFGGLHLSGADPNRSDEVLIDPVAAIESVYIERILEDYSAKAGSPLCVFGLCGSGHMVLMMDADGCVFGGYDETFLRFGEDGEAALERLCGRINS